MTDPLTKMPYEDVEAVREDMNLLCGQAQKRLRSLEGALVVLGELAGQERSAITEYQEVAGRALQEMRRRKP